MMQLPVHLCWLYLPIIAASAVAVAAAPVQLLPLGSHLVFFTTPVTSPALFKAYHAAATSAAHK
jgi:hypothetical protein